MKTTELVLLLAALLGPILMGLAGVHWLRQVIQLLTDIRDGIGRLLSFQTGAAAPWEMRDHIELMEARYRERERAAKKAGTTTTPQEPVEYD